MIVGDEEFVAVIREALQAADDVIAGGLGVEFAIQSEDSNDQSAEARALALFYLTGHLIGFLVNRWPADTLDNLRFSLMKIYDEARARRATSGDDNEPTSDKIILP